MTWTWLYSFLFASFYMTFNASKSLSFVTCTNVTLFLVLKIQVHTVVVGTQRICFQKWKRRTFGKAHRYLLNISIHKSNISDLSMYTWIDDYFCLTWNDVLIDGLAQSTSVYLHEWCLICLTHIIFQEILVICWAVVDSSLSCWQKMVLLMISIILEV